MRILHIIGTLDQQAGGPSNSIRAILAAYPASGSKGEVLTLDRPGASCLRETGFTVHAIGPAHLKFGYSPRLIPWLRANRTKYDAVVVHGLWQYIGWAVRRAVYPHTPFFVFTHGMLDPHFKRSYPAKHLKKTIYWLLNEMWVLRASTRVLFTSEVEAAEARRSFWPSIWKECIVPYGAHAPQGDPVTLRKLFLDAHPALRDEDGSTRPYILFLGRIHGKKGCDLLLEAFARIATQAPNLQLVLAGPERADAGGFGLFAPTRQSLKSRLAARASALGVANRVHWTGMLRGNDKWGAFYACEVFSLPSHQENFGIAVAEALACGKPVLISNKVNICKEIARDGAAFVAPDTLEGTQQMLEQWIALTPAQKITMGAMALDCFRRRYDMKANASGIVAIFSQILDSPGATPEILATAKTLQ